MCASFRPGGAAEPRPRVKTPRSTAARRQGRSHRTMSTISLELGTEAGDPFSFRGRPLTVIRGYPLPLGASLTPGGVNFVVMSRHATAVWLVLSAPRDAEIATEIPLEPSQHR